MLKRKKLILFVDDDPGPRNVLGRLLETYGYKIVYAGEGVDGIAKAKEHRPDLIIMDIEMPGMNGLAASAVLKNDVLTKDIPILMLTGYDTIGNVENGIKAGTQAFLTKPVDINRLLSKIEDLLANKTN